MTTRTSTVTTRVQKTSSPTRVTTRSGVKVGHVERDTQSGTRTAERPTGQPRSHAGSC